MIEVPDTSIAAETFLNIAVASGAMPTTGLPLPMISYGGNSLLSSLLTAGLLTASTFGTGLVALPPAQLARADVAGLDANRSLNPLVEKVMPAVVSVEVTCVQRPPVMAIEDDVAVKSAILAVPAAPWSCWTRTPARWPRS